MHAQRGTLASRLNDAIVLDAAGGGAWALEASPTLPKPSVSIPETLPRR